MANQLTGDLYWAEHGGPVEMKDPEFLHEALQRIIFNFLMENKTKPFMKLEKDPLHHREVEDQIRRHTEKQITPSKRTYGTMAGESESEEGEVSHLALFFTMMANFLVEMWIAWDGRGLGGLR